MKKILIVNNNMKIGGVQKALYNLLWETEGKYDITLCLFSRVGEYADKLPPSVRITEVKGAYRFLGVSQGECRGADALLRGACVLACRLLGRKRILKLFGKRIPGLHGDYDCAISYLHNGREKSFYGGTQDIVLDRVRADRKIAFLHCDYRNCGANHPANDLDMCRFDVIAACSEGCRRAFLSALPKLSDKCVTVRNCHRFDEIRAMANDDSVTYDSSATNILIVARLSHEKGVDRAIRALAYAIEKGLNARLHIVGDGAERESLAGLASQLKVEDSVIFYGNQGNPYRYMKNADVLLIPSRHEAAPMVIDEARAIGLPILTVKTTSAEDMVAERDCGWVCENSDEALSLKLCELLADGTALSLMKERMQQAEVDNSEALAQFEAAVN
jgi:glycosyltransferase involved in cell wall biosynthesis